MISIEELRRIPLFSGLAPAVLEFLVDAVEDIRLAPGEYVSREGDERALFVLVDGTAEITKLVGEQEQVISRRAPGELVGEVPMTLSTDLPASCRATTHVRVLRLEVPVFYTLAAMAPEVARTVHDLARIELETLRAFAEQPPDALVRIFGPRLDPLLHEVSSFLDRNQISFEHVHEPASASGTPTERYPVLEFSSGVRLVAPTMREVATAGGLQVTPLHADYDVVIIGGGPAGMTAAVNGAAEGLRTVVVERLAPGGQAGTSSRIENYTGFPYGISGGDLASRAHRQAQRLGAEIVVTRTVVALDPISRTVTLDGGDVLTTRTAVVSSGVDWRRMPLESIDTLVGSGVYYGAARSDAGVAQGEDVYIIGAGNSAGQAAIFFSRHARSVTLIVRAPALETSMSRYLIDQLAENSDIRIEIASEVVALHGTDELEQIDVRDNRTGETTRRTVSVLFVMIGADASTGWLPPEIVRDEHGYIATGPDALTEHWTAGRRPFALETSVPGVFAAGDVRSGSVKRVAAGVGEGGMAIAFVHQYLALA